MGVHVDKRLGEYFCDGRSELICRQGMVSNLLPDWYGLHLFLRFRSGPAVHSRKQLRADPSHGDCLYSLDIWCDGHI